MNMIRNGHFIWVIMTLLACWLDAACSTTRLKQIEKEYFL